MRLRREVNKSAHLRTLRHKRFHEDAREKKKRKVAGAASPSDKSDDGGERLAAVQALAAAVIAFPYDVPAHVPDALVLLAKHSNLAASSLRGSSCSKGDDGSSNSPRMTTLAWT